MRNMKNIIKRKQPYKKCYTWQKNRKIKISLSGGVCEKCGEKGREVHHKDKSFDNHSMDNLQFLCRSCHALEHSSGIGNHNSCHSKIYGVSLIKIAIEHDVPYSFVWRLHKHGKLEEFIDTKNYNIIRETYSGSKFKKICGYTLQEIGDKLGVSRQRVYQLLELGKLNERIQSFGIEVYDKEM